MKIVCAKVVLKYPINGQLHWRMEVDSGVLQHIEENDGVEQGYY